METQNCKAEINVLLDLLPTRPNVKAFMTMACNSETTINSGESLLECIEMIEQKD